MIYIGITLAIFGMGFVISEYELKRQRRKRREEIRSRSRRAVRGN